MPAPKRKAAPAPVPAPASSVSPADRRLRQRITLHSEDILTSMIDAAVDGDTTAGKFLLERVLAPQRTAPLGETVALTGSPADQAETVKRLLSEGRLSLDEADALLKSIDTAQRIGETTDALARLAELERRIAVLGDRPVPVRGVIDVDSQPALPAPEGTAP